MTGRGIFSVHAEPVWRDRADFIVNAPLSEENRFEQLWVRRVDDDVFEVCCIPFFLFDVALGDMVQTSPVGDLKYVVSQVVKSSGRWVFRTHFEAGQLVHRDAVAQKLVELGASLEWSSKSLLAIDVADAEGAQQVANFLQERTDLGQLIYETGRSA